MSTSGKDAFHYITFARDDSTHFECIEHEWYSVFCPHEATKKNEHDITGNCAAKIPLVIKIPRSFRVYALNLSCC